LPLAGFTAAAVYDMRGNEVMQVGRFSPNQVTLLSLHARRPDSFLVWDEGQFILRVSKDVLDLGGRRIGSITTEKNLPQLTRSFREIRAISKTGEFLLCTLLEAGGQEMACFMSKVDGVEFKHLPRMVGGVELQISYALGGNTGVIAAKDYRQVPVVAAHAPLSEFGLGMVLKLDEEELSSPATREIKTIALYLAGLVIAGMLLLYWLVVPLVRKVVKSEQEAKNIGINLLLAKEKAEQASAELLHAKEDVEQVSAERIAYIDGIGKLALVSVNDRSSRILHANAKFCEVSGYNEAESIGQNHRILNSGTHPKEFFAEMWATITRGDIWHQEICNRSKQGQLYWLDSTIVPLKDHDGKIIRFLSARVDITARKHRELALRERLKESACLHAIPNKD
jgi:PAS domain S-box-containing protein